MKSLRELIIRWLDGVPQAEAAAQQLEAVEKAVEGRDFVLPHTEYEFLPLDRPFDSMDWERLATLPKREQAFFEWLAHRLRQIDNQLTLLKAHPDHDRDRLSLLARRDEVWRTLRVGKEAAEKLAEIFRRLEKTKRLQDAKEGAKNHGR